RSVRLEVFIDGRELRKITAAVPVALIDTTFAQKASDEPRDAASEILLVGALGEIIANQRCDDDAGEDRSEAVGAEMEDEVRMLRVEQRHHRRRISGEYRTVCDDTALQVAEPGAKANPYGEADDEHCRMHHLAAEDEAN